MTAAATAILLRAYSRRAASSSAPASSHAGRTSLIKAAASRTARNQHCHPRFYSATLPSLSEAVATDEGEAAGDDSPPPRPSKEFLRRAALQYNNRRAAYKREVSKLRKQYAEEYARKKAADEAARAREQARLTRRRLERQRAKNTRSAINAAREKQKREERHREKEREYEIAQQERDIREGRMMKARQLLLDELEAEAPHWMTSAAEVEAKLGSGNPYASQILWARPGGVVGAPRVGGDDFNHLWRYECHHWDMARTYKTPRELLLEELEEYSYEEVNVDPTYWTAARVELAERKEEKAKLRAMVREQGRKKLLQRQREMMQDRRTRDAQRSEREIGFVMPTAVPVPHLGVLADAEAQEREGVKVLEEHPEKFFRFEGDDEQNALLDAADGQEGDEDDEGDTTTVRDSTALLLQRGAPTSLRDPLRDPHGGYPYPLVLGRMPEADDRTDAQKRRDERERKMLEAVRKAEEEAHAKKFGDITGGGGGGGVDKDIESAAESSLESGAEGIDYDVHGNTPSEFDRKWEEGLDPLNPEDALALATPGEYRYTDDDVDWILEQMQSKADTLREFYEMERESDRAALEQGGGVLPGEEPAAAAAPGGPPGGSGGDDDESESSSWMDSASRTEGQDRRGKFVQYDLPEYNPDAASVEDLLDQLDAAQRLVERGGQLPDDPASLVSKKTRVPPGAARAPPRTYPQEDELLDRLAQRLNLDEILDELDASDLSDLDEILDSAPSSSGGGGATLNASVDDVLSTLTQSQLDALSDISLSSAGEKLERALKKLDPDDPDDTLDESTIMDVLREALPEVEEDTLKRLLDVEMELERNAGVRKAVLGQRKKKEVAKKEEAASEAESEDAAEEEEEEGEAFDVVDVEAAEAPVEEGDEDEKGEDDKDDNGDDEKKP